jgi:hypothetical protein
MNWARGASVVVSHWRVRVDGTLGLMEHEHDPDPTFTFIIAKSTIENEIANLRHCSPLLPTRCILSLSCHNPNIQHLAASTQTQPFGAERFLGTNTRVYLL